MKLILKRTTQTVAIQSLADVRPRTIPSGDRNDGPFALHAENGEILPCQISTSMDSKGGEPVTLTVTFTVDGRDLVVEGDA